MTNTRTPHRFRRLANQFAYDRYVAEGRRDVRNHRSYESLDESLDDRGLIEALGANRRRLEDELISCDQQEVDEVRGDEQLVV